MIRHDSVLMICILMICPRLQKHEELHQPEMCPSEVLSWKAMNWNAAVVRSWHFLTLQPTLANWHLMRFHSSKTCAPAACSTGSMRTSGYLAVPSRLAWLYRGRTPFGGVRGTLQMEPGEGAWRHQPRVTWTSHPMLPWQPDSLTMFNPSYVYEIILIRFNYNIRNVILHARCMVLYGKLDDWRLTVLPFSPARRPQRSGCWVLCWVLANLIFSVFRWFWSNQRLLQKFVLVTNRAFQINFNISRFLFSSSLVEKSVVRLAASCIWRSKSDHIPRHAQSCHTWLEKAALAGFVPMLQLRASRVSSRSCPRQTCRFTWLGICDSRVPRIKLQTIYILYSFLV